MRHAGLGPTAVELATTGLGYLGQRVRQEVGIPVSSAWGFGEPHIAEQAVRDGQLDLVMVGKAHLANPHWAYHAARELMVDRRSEERRVGEECGSRGAGRD